MTTTFLVAVIPVIISVLSLLVSFIHGSNKNRTGIIDSLSREMNNKKPNPYIIQACISRIHQSRPIPYNILQKILCFNNAFEIIQRVSVGRKALDILKFSVVNNRIALEYSDMFSKRRDRWMTMLVCAFSLVICYSTSVYMMFRMMFIVDTMSVMDSTRISAWGSILPELCGLVFFMFMMTIFSWQFIIIATSKNRIDRIQKLIDENYCDRNRSTIRTPRNMRN
ncbi:hypothetical protein [Leclercia adecarboxylata]|uniref:hypothetical protein n=1 Tax=Leclercia adecarboxylata TaxID=83655 RepID=UPI00384B13E4